MPGLAAGPMAGPMAGLLAGLLAGPVAGLVAGPGELVAGPFVQLPVIPLTAESGVSITRGASVLPHLKRDSLRRLNVKQHWRRNRVGMISEEFRP